MFTNPVIMVVLKNNLIGVLNINISLNANK